VLQHKLYRAMAQAAVAVVEKDFGIGGVRRHALKRIACAADVAASGTPARRGVAEISRAEPDAPRPTRQRAGGSLGADDPDRIAGNCCWTAIGEASKLP
jgi:hypothetical protein